MGDEAEGVFTTWAERTGVAAIPYGLNRPPFDLFQYLPRSVRWRPDFLCEDRNDRVFLEFGIETRKHYFVEVKGVGRDQFVKIKHDHLDVLAAVEEFDNLKVLFFIYDSHYKRITMESLGRVSGVQWNYPQGVFREGTSYVKIPTAFFTWVSVERE